MNTSTEHVDAIDMAPTWGEIGILFYRLAVSKEVRALEAARTEFTKAFAMAQALKELAPSLTADQRTVMNGLVAAELRKQGVK